jgi:predicted tellurium resistance membrane protein TerC/Mg2+/Co2+ transporter CorC
MEWLADPTVWLGLLTLTLLEVVLGIDNLIFIAILADRLPAHQRDRARLIGLALALFMRVGLLFSISWLVTLTAPLFHVFSHPFSGRDLILLAGGLFLLYKSTVELHSRLEGAASHAGERRVHAGFWTVVAQIVALDAVFSLDSVITAVGMADELAVMVAAVVIAIIIMMVASRPLTEFVSHHPTVVVLCLGFLLMIGFSLIAEGVGLHIPKGYLYAAIGFSVLIEILNQIAQRRREARTSPSMVSSRERTADAVMRLLGGGATPDEPQSHTGVTSTERNMVGSVLGLAERPLAALMTPRERVHVIDLEDSPEQQARVLAESPYSRLVVIRDGQLDQPLGLVHKAALLEQALAGRPPDIAAAMHPAPALPDSFTALRALDEFRQRTTEAAFVADADGVFQGLVTRQDLAEAIAGEFPDPTDRAERWITTAEDGALLAGAGTPLPLLRRRLQQPLAEGAGALTLAGLLAPLLGGTPNAGDRVDIASVTFEIDAVEGDRIERVRIYPHAAGQG